MREKQWLCPYCYLYPHTSLAPSPSGQFNNSVTAQSTALYRVYSAQLRKSFLYPFYSNMPTDQLNYLLIANLHLVEVELGQMFFDETAEQLKE